MIEERKNVGIKSNALYLRGSSMFSLHERGWS